jgi:thiol-disulfide isomerase/thioredoxin
MKNKIRHYIKEILLFTVVMIVFANIISMYKSSDLNKESLNINFSYDKNKPILVHIWASWCPTCKLEASNIQTISKDYEVLTFIVKSGSDAKVKEYMQENDFDFKTINDKNGFYSKKFKVSAYPTTLIYNKNQELVFSEVGYTSTLGLKLRMWYASF